MARFGEHEEFREYDERSVDHVLVILGKQLKQRLDRYAETSGCTASAAAADLIRRGLDAADAAGVADAKPPSSPPPVRRFRKQAS